MWRFCQEVPQYWKKVTEEDEGHQEKNKMLFNLAKKTINRWELKNINNIKKDIYELSGSKTISVSSYSQSRYYYILTFSD